MLYSFELNYFAAHPPNICKLFNYTFHPFGMFYVIFFLITFYINDVFQCGGNLIDILAYIHG